MHVKEARWLAERLAAMPDADLDPMINIGASTEEFRCVQQPHIDEIIFKPLRERGIRVVHHDIKRGSGIDLVADLDDPRFTEQLVDMDFKTLLCTNVLEHVASPADVAAALLRSAAAGCYLVVTVPSVYPKHMDPIGNMYRPTPRSFSSSLMGAELVDSETVAVGTVLRSMGSKPRELTRLLVRVALPMYRPSGWVTALHRLGWMFAERSIACAILRKASKLEEERVTDSCAALPLRACEAAGGPRCFVGPAV